jgi:DNA-directed RNA polymerase sigma subunit (sigma70/sigma32)
MSANSTVRIKMTPQNNHILSKMEEMGFRTKKELALFIGIDQGTLSSFIHFDYKRMGETATVKIAEKLNLSIDKVNPQWVKEFVMGVKNTIHQIDDEKIILQLQEVKEEVLSLPEPDYFSTNDLRININRVLDTLSDKERAVISLFYGLNGNPIMDYEQISYVVNLTRERVREIKYNAIKHLRRSTRIEMLKQYLYNDK